MPLYLYRCTSCATMAERFTHNREQREIACPECGKQAERIIANSSFHLSGGGWYKDGYSNK